MAMLGNRPFQHLCCPRSRVPEDKCVPYTKATHVMTNRKEEQRKTFRCEGFMQLTRQVKIVSLGLYSPHSKRLHPRLGQHHCLKVGKKITKNVRKLPADRGLRFSRVPRGS